MRNELRDWLDKNARSAIRIVDGNLDSLSWLGGNPTVPPGFQWPTFRGQALPFLGQIHLADLPSVDGVPALPKTGTLYFFFAIEGGMSGDIGSDASNNRMIHAALHGVYAGAPTEEIGGKGFAVVYVDHETGLTEATPPGVPPAQEPPKGWRKLFNYKLRRGERRSYDRKPITFQPIVTRSDEVPEDLLDSDDELEMEEILYGQSDSGVHHQLFGYPQPVQSTAEEMARQVSQPRLGPGDENWVLLLQVDEDRKTGFEWVDCGKVFFWIMEQDLAHARFDRVRAIIDFS